MGGWEFLFCIYADQNLQIIWENEIQSSSSTHIKSNININTTKNQS